MTKYELWLAKYATFINDLEEILNDPDWKEELNDIAEDIALAYDYRKALEKAPKKLRPQISEWDGKLLKLGNRLRRLHKPAYEYFKKHFNWLHRRLPATAAEPATKS
jgi:hypothetical protein